MGQDGTGTERYGYCKRSKAWVLRDAMLAVRLHLTAFRADGTEAEDRLIVRLAPEAQADFVRKLLELEWDGVLKTRAELAAAGEPILDVVPAETTDTQAWYEARHGSASDDVLVARTALRPLRGATGLAAAAAVILAAANRVAPETLLGILRAQAAKVPRWDHGAAAGVDPIAVLRREMPNWPVTEALVVTADLDEVLIVALVRFEDGPQVRVGCWDHGCSEIAHRRAGRLPEEPGVTPDL